MSEALGPRREKTKKGKRRDFRRDAKNERDAVLKAIKTAVKKIKQKDSAAATHFFNSIKFHDLLSYEPDIETVWSFV